MCAFALACPDTGIAFARMCGGGGIVGCRGFGLAPTICNGPASLFCPPVFGDATRSASCCVGCETVGEALVAIAAFRWDRLLLGSGSLWWLGFVIIHSGMSSCEPPAAKWSVRPDLCRALACDFSFAVRESRGWKPWLSAFLSRSLRFQETPLPWGPWMHVLIGGIASFKATGD